MLRELFDARVGSALEEALRNDKAYIEVKERTKDKVDQVEKIGLTPSQWVVVDEALEADNEQSSEYGRVAYCLGVRDAVNLLLESYRMPD